jgi:hypothetical protein
VGLARGAGPEVREDLVDHRRLRHERDDARALRLRVIRSTGGFRAQ